MQKVNVESKDEEKTVEECQCNAQTDEKTEDYKVYGADETENATNEESRDAADDAKKAAEKMLNDVYATFKSKQKEWNKTFEEYTANKPLIDLFEYDDCLVLKMDLPRVKKDDISITMAPDSIEITAEFPSIEDENKEVKILRRERCTGRTKNIIPIPVDVKVEDVSASFENFELVVTLPKVKPKKVDVEIV